MYIPLPEMILTISLLVVIALKKTDPIHQAAYNGNVEVVKLSIASEHLSTYSNTTGFSLRNQNKN